MEKQKVCKSVPKKEVPETAKVINSTCACRKNSNITYRARLNTRVFDQKDGEYYDSTPISAPMTNDATICISLLLMIMVGWVGELLGVKGVFLHEEFEDGKEIYMKNTEDFEHLYIQYVLLLLLKTICGLKKEGMEFWRQLLRSFISMGYTRSKADSFLYFFWTMQGLVIFCHG